MAIESSVIKGDGGVIAAVAEVEVGFVHSRWRDTREKYFVSPHLGKGYLKQKTHESIIGRRNSNQVEENMIKSAFVS